MHLFCIAVAQAFQRIAATFPDASAVLAFADDARVGAPPAELSRIFGVATDQFRQIGLELQVRKSEVWQPEGCDRIDITEFPTGLQVTDTGLTTVGCPMGTQEFVDDHFSRVLDYHGDLRDAIVRMGEEYPVEAMRMMQVWRADVSTRTYESIVKYMCHFCYRL